MQELTFHIAFPQRRDGELSLDLLFVFKFVVMGIELKVLHILSMGSSTELSPEARESHLLSIFILTHQGLILGISVSHNDFHKNSISKYSPIEIRASTNEFGSRGGVITI